MGKIIDFTPPSTSHIRRLTYDPDAQALHVTFANGSSYTHTDVPPRVFNILARQNSPGTYYHAVIKRHYKLTSKRTV